MTLAVIHTRALVGLHAPDVIVEVHLANGLPSFTLVGLADTEVKEARERVRAALSQSGFAFPHNKKIQCSQANLVKSEQGKRTEPAPAPGRTPVDGYSLCLLVRSMPSWGGAR